ncbi:hypothetical protein V6N12_035750 [Hibiscus sabdariffa]|uniref:RNase H type-1 domain-containing protein n=1 Tax=Hibiscus sabdariffa TaxID=183260 RepID=A0ABR2ENL8_9ROSI
MDHLRNRNLTNGEWSQHHMSLSKACDICGFHLEDMNHVRRHCVAARALWLWVIHPDLIEDFMLAPFDTWLKQNLAPATTDLIHGSRWKSRFAIYCWLLCKDRGSVILALDNTYREDIISRGNRGQAAIGGIIRDEHGVWVVGFTRPVGRCSILVVELWALHDMLARAWSFGFRRIVVETDKLEVVETFPNPLESLIARIDFDKNSPLFDSLVPRDWFDVANVVCFNLHADPGG